MYKRCINIDKWFITHNVDIHRSVSNIFCADIYYNFIIIFIITTMFNNIDYLFIHQPLLMGGVIL